MADTNRFNKLDARGEVYRHRFLKFVRKMDF